jgi:acyl carrier protein
MGLDTVELVIRFEDSFAISIPDKVAAELTTPRKVTDYILSQIQVSSQNSCVSQQAFYFLRKKFVGVLGIPRGEFHPENQLESLIPFERRRENWLKMTDELGVSSLPTLARPVWLFLSLAFLSVLGFVTANVYARNHDGGASFSFIFGLFVATSVGYIGAVATRPLQRHFRKGYERPRDLAKFLVANNPLCFKREWTRDQVAETVREIIVDETGVSDFNEDSHFIEDMNLD